MKKIDGKYIFWALFLIALYFVAQWFYEPLVDIACKILTFSHLNIYVGGIAIIFTLLNKLKTVQMSFSGNMSFKSFHANVSDIISFVDNPIILVGALGLSEGLFLHYVENVRYFPYLEEFEITLILFVTLYLLYISVFELVRDIRTVVFIQPSSGKPTADPQKGDATPTPEPQTE